MSAMTYLHKHPETGVYWFRHSVPSELRSTIGKREILKSLGTKDVREAKRLCMDVASEVDRLFAFARSGADITLANAEARAAAWKAETLAESAEEFAAGPQRTWVEIEELLEAWKPFAKAEREELTTGLSGTVRISVCGRAYKICPHRNEVANFRPLYLRYDKVRRCATSRSLLCSFLLPARPAISRSNSHPRRLHTPRRSMSASLP